MKQFDEQWKQLLLQASCGNQDAYKFLYVFLQVCHGVDDIIDGDIKSSEEVMEVFHIHHCIFSNPFYQQYQRELWPVICIIRNAYTDSVAWEKSTKLVEKEVSNVIRSQGNDIIIAVALICGDWKLVRNISLKIRTLANHYQREGEIINYDTVS